MAVVSIFCPPPWAVELSLLCVCVWVCVCVCVCNCVCVRREGSRRTAKINRLLYKGHYPHLGERLVFAEHHLFFIPFLFLFPFTFKRHRNGASGTVEYMYNHKPQINTEFSIVFCLFPVLSCWLLPPLLPRTPDPSSSSSSSSSSIPLSSCFFRDRRKHRSLWATWWFV